MTVQDLEIFGRVVQSSPARELVETAPHVFTGRGYKLEDIIIILDAYAHRGIDLSYGTLKIGMDLADAQWEIIRDTSTESVITLTDRLCFEIPKSDKAETNQGRALLKKYWEIYEAAKQRSGIKKGRDDQSEGVVNINALRSELNALRGTYTCYGFKNTEGIEDDVNNIWLPPLRTAAASYRSRQKNSRTSKKDLKFI